MRLPYAAFRQAVAKDEEIARLGTVIAGLREVWCGYAL